MTTSTTPAPSGIPRARRRADKKHGIEVTIHDRSWILQQVVEFDRKDLAYNYLHVGQEIADASQLGPARSRQLEAIEKAFSDPDSFSGMERQGVVRPGDDDLDDRNQLSSFVHP